MCPCDIHPNIGEGKKKCLWAPGCTGLQWLALSLHSWVQFPVGVELACCSTDSVPPSECFASLPWSKDIECECVWLFVSVCQPGDELAPCAGSTPLSLPKTAAIDTSPSVTLKRISGDRWWMDVVIRRAYVATIRLTGLFGHLKHLSKPWICNISIL